MEEARYKQIATFAIAAILALLLYPLSVASQNTFSMSLDADSAAGDQAVTSASASADQVVSIQVFGSTMRNATAFGLRFEYDDAQVTYQGFDAGSVLPGTPQVLPEHGMNPTCVEMSYETKYDLDSNGTIGISDFLIFVNNFGSSGGSGGGGGGGGGDDHGDTQFAATELSVNSRIQGALETDSDVDYFSVQVREAGTLVAYTTGSLDTYGELYSPDSTDLVASNDNYTDGFNFRIWESVEPGTYYIKVLKTVGDTGSYTLSVGFATATSFVSRSGCGESRAV